GKGGSRGRGGGGEEGDGGSLGGVQGVPARMSRRRGHGSDENRVSAPLAPATSDLHSRKAHRIPAAVCACRKPFRPASQLAQQGSESGSAGGEAERHQRQAKAAQLAPGHLPRAGVDPARAGGVAVRRLLLSLLRTRERAGRSSGAGGGGLHRGGRRLDAAAVLRAYLPERRPRRRGPRGAVSSGGRAGRPRKGGNPDRGH